MSVVIRPSRLTDSEELGSVHVAAWQAAYRGIMPDDYLDGLDPVANARRRRRNFDDPSRTGTELAAELDGRVVGFSYFGPPRDEVPDGWGELWVINLHPGVWRRGIGTRLFAAAVDGLRDAGYRHGYLWVVADNQRAVEFYRRQGWVSDGATKIDQRFGPPVTEIRCSARLTDQQ
ncbi:GNAT family N-acetyltransferase [Microlunatus soli]|uniref:L-amino acid N-acyltransferase YncA n=1 Tax=Microlunatus soli TaxID=630515 RepID=A0A1H1NRC0_9ACTN|nr:GNAT family N-acetyltransferase [Microlunatus soli]SDS01330.1 L-amino acid N-acyltransferase YncA [Microlunatus soli]